MKKTIVSLLWAATIVVMVAATATDASAQWRGRGWGWGPGIAAGVIGGAVIAGAIIASRPPGYVVYPGYAQPVYAPGCYWASLRVYDGAGRVVGYNGQPVQVCPGYSGPPPGYAGAPPGYAGGARLRAIRSPPACSASGHTIRKPEPIWATMASATPVREPERRHEPLGCQSIELMLKSGSFIVYTTDLGEEGIDLGELLQCSIIRHTKRTR